MKNYALRNIPNEQYRALRIMAAEKDMSVNSLLLKIIRKETKKRIRVDKK